MMAIEVRKIVLCPGLSLEVSGRHERIRVTTDASTYIVYRKIDKSGVVHWFSMWGGATEDVMPNAHVCNIDPSNNPDHECGRCGWKMPDTKLLEGVEHAGRRREGD